MGPGFGNEVGKLVVGWIIFLMVMAFCFGVGCAIAWRYLPSVEVHWKQPASPPQESAGERSGG